MTTHVLVAMDDSAPSWDALEHAITRYPEARMTILHVLDPGLIVAMGDGLGPVASDEAFRDDREQAASFLADAAAEATDAGVDAETDVIEGRPSRSIPEYAAKHDIDHVILGSHGRTGVRRVLLGSVAEQVVRSTRVPVTVVR